MAIDLRPQIATPDYSSLVQGYQPPANNLLASTMQGFNTVAPMAQKLQQKKKWSDAIDQMVKENPHLAPYAGAFKNDPSLMGQILPGLTKPVKQPMEWSAVGGMLSKAGHPMVIDKTTGQMREIPIDAAATGGSAYATVRQNQYGLQDLPSNQPPNTAGGAAYQVKVAARQGKSLIAKAGSGQKINLASGDLARAVTRSAPLAEIVGGADYGNNWRTRANILLQKITAEADGPDAPQMRRELYNMFDELDESATPWISNQLDAMVEHGFPVSAAERKRQLGLNIPNMPFIELPDQVPPPSQTKSGPFSKGALSPAQQAIAAKLKLQ